MKPFLLCLFLSVLLLSGCMDTYKLNEYKSPKEFDNFVNKEIKGHSLDVHLMRDSTIETDNLHINSDSAF